MKSRSCRTQVTFGVLKSLLGAAACFAVAAEPAWSGEEPPVSSGHGQTGLAASDRPEVPAAVPEAAPGMMIYLDPQTGAVLSAPAPGTVPLPLTPELQNALSTSHQGLVEVPNPVPGGGFKLDLQGRFQSPLGATIDANGN